MSRSILCGVVRSIFSCSLVVAHVPAPYVIVGATTASNRCNRCRCKYDWDVSSCRCLANADQAHRILCYTSVVSWFTNVVICTKYSTFPSGRSISTYISPMSLNLFVFWFVKILVLLWWISSPCASVLFEIRDHFLICFKKFAIMSTSSAKRRFDIQSLSFHRSV